MTAFATLLKAVQAEVPACPGPFVYTALSRTARDLCDKTFCWKDDAQTASMTSGTNQITLTLPSTADLVAVEYLSFNGVELVQTSERSLSLSDPRWRQTTGDPTHFFPIVRDGVLQVYPTPNRSVADAFQYEAYIKPKADATVLSEFLVEQYDETLLHGAAHQLLKMPGRPWFNPDLAQYHRRYYRQGVYEARDKTVRMFASQNLNIIPQALV